MKARKESHGSDLRGLKDSRVPNPPKQRETWSDCNRAWLPSPRPQPSASPPGLLSADLREGATRSHTKGAPEMALVPGTVDQCPAVRTTCSNRDSHHARTLEEVWGRTGPNTLLWHTAPGYMYINECMYIYTYMILAFDSIRSQG